MGVEGYSPAVIEKVVYQGSKTPSFAEAAADLVQLAGIPISPSHVRRLCQRVGEEWGQSGDEEVNAYMEGRLPRGVATPPAVAAVMLDGGRVQTRAGEQGRGVFEPGWKETKVACCLSLVSHERLLDPQPSPPRRSWTRAGSSAWWPGFRARPAPPRRAAWRPIRPEAAGGAGRGGNAVRPGRKCACGRWWPRPGTASGSAGK